MLQISICLSSLFFIFPSIINAQFIEICDNDIDDDGDGLIDEFDPDCYDVAECYTIGITQDTAAFVPVLKCEYLTNGIVTYSPPMFADVDGDGETEIVALMHQNPNGFVVINTETCAVEHSVDVGLDVGDRDGGLCLGDVDNDGLVDVFVVGHAFGVQYRMVRYEYNPVTGNMEQIWNSIYNFFAIDLRPHVDIIDLNQDGSPELIPNRGRMVDAITGNVYDENVPQLSNQGKGLFAFTAHADPGEAPAGQGNVEVLRGSRIYRYDFANGAWIIVREQADYNWEGNSNASVADMDGDGDVDGIISNNDTGEAIIWDLQTDALIGYFDYPGNFGSRINITNLDDDQYPEMIMTSNSRIFVIDDIITTGGFGNILWLQNTSDASGHTQVTSFDFDNDGDYEIIYRDDTELLILQGQGTGIPTGLYPSGPKVLLATGAGSCVSATGMEYPTIGDVDNDGHAEIISNCEGRVSIYQSGGFPWGDAVSVWNTNAYNIVNVNQDGTIPAVMQENYLLFNNFLSQIHPEPPYDTILIPSPDAFVMEFDFASDCEGAGGLAVEICNQGDSLLVGPFPIAFYDGDPRLASTNLIDVFWEQDNMENDTCRIILVENLIPISEGDEVFILINDNGSESPPLDLAGPNDFGDFPTFLPECDYPNNLDSLTVTLSFTVNTALNETICEGESYEVGSSSYTLGGSYLDTLSAANGCDSLVALNLNVMPASFTPFMEVLCAGESYELNNEIYTTTGIYADTLVAANGCDSIVSLDLTVNTVYDITIDSTICEGESVQIGGSIYTTSGNYSDMLQAFTSCDSVVNLNLVVQPIYEIQNPQTICDGQSIVVGNSTYNTTGMYTDILQSVAGCDSTVFTDLQVVTEIIEPLNEQICDGQSYFVGTSEYTLTGNYVDTLMSSIGCDSIIQLDLLVASVFNENEVGIICEGESYFVDSQEFTIAGDYTIPLTTSGGCDSIVALNLTVNSIFELPNPQTICEGESISVGNMTYNTSGNYSDTLQTISGCDSIINTTLEVFDIYDIPLNEQICDGQSYFVGTSEYTMTGNYIDTLQSLNGCDSIVQLDLVVASVFNENEVGIICEGESYFVDNQEFTTTGDYTIPLTTSGGCDSIVALNLTVNSIFELPNPQTICDGESISVGNMTYNISGNYSDTLQTISGCDSIINTTLNVLDVFETPLNEQICTGESYFVGTSEYTATGNYIDTLQSTNGCDSIVLLELLVANSFEEDEAGFICEGETYLVGDETFTAAGEYDVDLLTAGGCDSLVHLNLTVHPIYSVPNPQTICDGESVVVGNSTYNTAGTFTDILQTINNCDSTIETTIQILDVYSTPLSEQICVGQNVQIGTSIYTETGNYIDTLTAQNGCDSIVALDLEVLSVFNENESAIICAGESYSVGNQEFTQTGDYTIELTSSGGCDSIVALNLVVNAAPFSEAEAEICSNDSLYIGGAFQNTAGIYNDTLTTNFGCDSIVETTLIIYPEIIISGENALICPGDAAQLEVQGATEYTWFPTEGLSCTNCPNPIATPSETTIYTVTSEGCLGAIAMTEIMVEVEMPIGVEVIENQEVTLGESIVLNAIGSDEIIWQIGDTIVCEYCDELAVSPTETTIYDLQYTDENGCIGYTQITVNVLDGCPEAEITIPNIISPNNDGSNDIFYVRAKNIEAFTHLRIYNRWGEQVFESTDISEAWDGTFRGQALAPDVYVYYMEYICLNGRVELLSGNVTILK